MDGKWIGTEETDRYGSIRRKAQPAAYAGGSQRGAMAGIRINTEDTDRYGDVVRICCRLAAWCGAMAGIRINTEDTEKVTTDRI